MFFFYVFWVKNEQETAQMDNELTVQDEGNKFLLIVNTPKKSKCLTKCPDEIRQGWANWKSETFLSN